MAYEQITRYHQDAAAREERAAADALCEASYHVHHTLAELHRSEAAKRSSITDALRVPFGD
jgi:hypothetical protein